MMIFADITVAEFYLGLAMIGVLFVAGVLWIIGYFFRLNRDLAPARTNRSDLGMGIPVDRSTPAINESGIPIEVDDYVELRPRESFDVVWLPSVGHMRAWGLGVVTFCSMLEEWDAWAVHQLPERGLFRVGSFAERGDAVNAVLVAAGKDPVTPTAEAYRWLACINGRWAPNRIN